MDEVVERYLKLAGRRLGSGPDAALRLDALRAVVAQKAAVARESDPTLSAADAALEAILSFPAPLDVARILSEEAAPHAMPLSRAAANPVLAQYLGLARERVLATTGDPAKADAATRALAATLDARLAALGATDEPIDARLALEAINAAPRPLDPGALLAAASEAVARVADEVGAKGAPALQRPLPVR